MENILIVNQVALAATVADLGDLDALPVGAVIAIADGKKVLNASTVAADLDDVEGVVFMTKLSTGNFRTSVNIPRRNITDVNYQIYTAPQNKIMRIGALTDEGKLVIEDNQEINISALNMSYNRTIASQRVNISVTKRSGETASAFVDRIVAKLNADFNNTPKFFTATKLQDVTDADNPLFAIQFETANEHIDLHVGVDGTFMYNTAIVTQEAKVSMGKGSDVLQMEKDFSRHLGNNNYVEMNDAWYSQALQASAGTNYNIATLAWKGIAPKITTSIHAANNTLAFAIPTGSSVTALLTLLRLIAGTAYSGDGLGGAVVLDSAETNEIDNNPAT